MWGRMDRYICSLLKLQYVPNISEATSQNSVDVVKSLLARVDGKSMQSSNWRQHFSSLLHMEDYYTHQEYKKLTQRQVPLQRGARANIGTWQVDMLDIGDDVLSPGNRISCSFGHGDVHEAYISFRSETRITIDFASDVFSHSVSRRDCTITFLVNRIPVRRSHQALELMMTKPAAIRQALLFPNLATGSTLLTLSSPQDGLLLHPVMTYNLGEHAIGRYGSDYQFMSGYDIVVTNDPNCCRLWIANNIYVKKPKFVGFDTEYKRYPDDVTTELAVIQLCVDQKVMVFFCHGHRALPDTMKQLLTDRSIVKFAVGAQHDVVVISSQHDLQMIGIVELQELARDCLPAGTLTYNLPGMKLLASKLLGINLNKSQQVSDWTVWPLTNAQALYAASDAVIAWKLADHLCGGTPPAGTIWPRNQSWRPECDRLEDGEYVATLPSNLNAQQVGAVQAIISAEHRPYPYLLFGPAGTGTYCQVSQ